VFVFSKGTSVRRILTIFLATAGLVSLSFSAVTVGASTSKTYALGNAKTCHVGYVKKTLRHLVKGKEVRYLACVSVPPFNALYVGGLTGPDAQAATAAMQGMKAAATYLNANGGIIGHRVDLTVVDDQATATLAISDLSSYLSTHSTLNAIWPGSSSTEGLAIAATLTANKIYANGVVTSPLAINPTVNPYFFDETGLITLQGNADVKWLKSLGITNVGFLYENFATGIAEEATQAGVMQANGITVTAESYPMTATNVTPQMQSLQSAGVKALIIDGLGTPVGLALTARATMAWSVPTLGDGMTSGTFNTTGVPTTNLTGVKWMVQTISAYNPKPSAGFYVFYKAVTKLAGSLAVPMFEYAAGWDTLMQADVAAIQAKSITGPAITHALENLKPVKNPPYVLTANETYSPTVHALPQVYAIVNMGIATDGWYDIPAGGKLP
jgi:branched-chain amino acid transport system substrate-binding protein